ncbi:hypothetical protein LF63_0112520 [Oleiagrimonas soli]|uniref:Uncharacterized protein n=1 Tax=Oleiagrimonas soli TaxID=1543381 RepID=A0A099CVN2_9GAMM|nr:hypothetical protein LF63_0112520 [Oleiagrimonas soli]
MSLVHAHEVCRQVGPCVIDAMHALVDERYRAATTRTAQSAGRAMGEKRRAVAHVSGVVCLDAMI